MVCIALSCPGEITRAGVVASRRVGGAVQRNRAKRRLRHGLREVWESLPDTGFQIVLIATSGTGQVDYAQLLAELRRSLSELGVIQEIEPATSKSDPRPNAGKVD
jgi:ribonuclease P protein component